MRTVPGWEGTDFVATLLHPEAEYNYGLTLPAFGAMFTRMYMDRYGLTERDLAILAVKDHENGEKNPFAHVRIPCTLEGIFDSPDANVVNNYIAEPLRLYGMCPVSDGAASIIMCATDSQKIKHFSKKKPVLEKDYVLLSEERTPVNHSLIKKSVSFLKHFTSIET